MLWDKAFTALKLLKIIADAVRPGNTSITHAHAQQNAKVSHLQSSCMQGYGFAILKRQ